MAERKSLKIFGSKNGGSGGEGVKRREYGGVNTSETLPVFVSLSEVPLIGGFLLKVCNCALSVLFMRKSGN